MTPQQQQKGISQIVDKVDPRQERGKLIAVEKTIYKISGKDIFFVESQSSDSRFYYIGYKANEYEWCSCLDNSLRGFKCKHIFAVEESIKQGTVIEKEEFPSTVVKPQGEQLQYTKEEYSF